MPKRNCERSAGALIYRMRGRTPEFLLIKSARDCFWGLPKGHVRAGETERAAALREVAEETSLRGVRLAEGFERSIFYRVSKKERRVLKEVEYFLAPAPRGKVRLSPEHTEFKWATVGEADALIAFPNIRMVIARAARFIAEGSR